MDDPIKARDAAECFAREHINELVREMISWFDGGLLPDGRLRELASICCAIDGRRSYSLAKAFVEQAALYALTSQQARITALEDEVKALRKAAERYQWLNDRFVGADFEWNADSEGNGGVPVLCIRMYEKQVVFGDLSMTIDAALSAASDGVKS